MASVSRVARPNSTVPVIRAPFLPLRHSRARTIQTAASIRPAMMNPATRALVQAHARRASMELAAEIPAAFGDEDQAPVVAGGMMRGTYLHGRWA